MDKRKILEHVKANPTNPPTPDLLMVVHHAGKELRCLFVDQKDTTIIDGIVIENETELTSLIQARRPEQIVSILPGSSTICRTSLLPDTDEEQLQNALRLQAEAKLLGGTPEHRRALATLPCTAGESSRIGLIIAWPEETDAQVPQSLQGASFIP